ncbi:MAG: PBP1A family penicillin-binding protein [Coriobacteriales bacterium]|nr:PBP1A family penicillin-binding protein [Coriobacteriales bacterium]
MSSRKKRARKQPKKHIGRFTLIIVLVVILGISGLTGAGLYSLFQSWLVDLPSIDGIADYNTEGKTRIWAADGATLLAELYYFDRTPVTSDRVSPYVFNATVAVEDERFYQHKGVDYYGIARAIYVDLTTNRVEGASTITQQLVRQTILQEEANDITIRRKVREAVLAQQLEELYTKEEILMMYLNTINFGDGCWGIQSAAQHYFSKDAADLSLVEAALICGIPQSPEYNNPVNYPENALRRRNIVLDRMYVNGYINEDELNTAKATEIELVLSKRTVDGIYLAPYATSYVRKELMSLLSTDVIFRGGLDVYTSIDLNYQQWAEDVCIEREATLPDGFEVSITCVDPNTGYILCMRGGKDYYEDQFNTCWQMRRSAGSSFKVFGLVACLEKGYSPQTMVSGDSPIQLGDWRVANYGGSSMGNLTLAQATWYSSNTAYVRVVRTIGPDSIVDVAKRMGITSDIRPFNSIVLGSEGVCTLEMASAVGTLATDGIHNKPTSIIRIVDRNGTVLHEHVPENEQVLTPEVAYAAVNVLRGVVQYGTGTYGAISGRDIAGKTGTSENWTDAWFVGFTPQLCTAVWVGNRDNLEFMSRNEGGQVAAPIWRSFMVRALGDRPAEEFQYAPAPQYRSNGDFMTPEEREVYKLKTTDSDGDTFSDWDEIQAGTDPKDPNSYPGKVEDVKPPVDNGDGTKPTDPGDGSGGGTLDPGGGSGGSGGDGGGTKPPTPPVP